MPAFLTDDEFAGMVQKMTATAVAIFANEEGLQLEAVEARTPLGFRQRLGLKRPSPSFIVHGARFAPGMRDMEGLLYQQNGHIMIAVKVLFGRQKVQYETYSITEYVHCWLTDDRRATITAASESVAEAQWLLERLLPDGHPLKRPTLEEIIRR